MTPEQIEAILQSNAKAIASNSDTIAEVRKETNNTIAETRREITALYQFASELNRDRSVMFQILQGLNEDRISTAENLASIAENIARIAAAMEQRNE